MLYRLMFLVMLLLTSYAYTQQTTRIIEPQKENISSFAIVIDNETFQKTEKEVLEYRNAVEDDGLSTYILINDWKSPELIREEVIKLYEDESSRPHSLEPHRLFRLNKWQEADEKLERLNE